MKETKIQARLSSLSSSVSLAKEEVTSSAFDVFKASEYEVSTKECQTQTFYPVSSTSSSGPFGFIIPPDPFFNRKIVHIPFITQICRGYSEVPFRYTFRKP